MEASTDVETLLRYKAKAVLRQRARNLRGTIPTEAIAQRSAAIIERLAALREIRDARSVALFYPMERRHEVDLRAFDAELRARGVRVAYPRVDAPDDEPAPIAQQRMAFHFTASIADLAERGQIYLEPPGASEEAQALDVIVVPALQVDARGHRIGYGAGFYDRTIPRYAPPARTIVVAFDFQLIAEVPITEGDVACQIIVTDKRVITASG